jgi:drug/metabolite transporter (DMT)-like permease
MRTWLGPFYLFLAFALAGTSVISGKLVSGKLGTFTIAAASLFFALLFLLPICGRRLRESLRAITAKDFRYLVYQAVLGIFLFRILLLYGLLHTSSVEAGILTGTTPAITALLAVVLLKERVNRIMLTGILGTVFGIFVLQGLLSGDMQFSWHHSLGNSLVLCAAASESAFNILSRVFAVKTASSVLKTEIHPVVQTAVVSAIAFVLCLIPAFGEAPLQRLSAIGSMEWLALLWYGVFVTALAFICWYAGIKRANGITAAAFSGMMPLTSMLLSVSLLGEHAGWQQWLGGLLIMSAMVLIGIGSWPKRQYFTTTD